MLCTLSVCLREWTSYCKHVWKAAAADHLIDGSDDEGMELDSMDESEEEEDDDIGLDPVEPSNRGGAGESSMHNKEYNGIGKSIHDLYSSWL